MRSSTASLSLALSVAVSAALAAPAVAGPVSQVVHGIDNKIDTHSTPQSAPPPPPQPSPPRVPPDRGSDEDDAAVRPVATEVIVVDGDDGAGSGGGSVSPGAIVQGPARVELYLGGQAVVGSDKAALGEVRVSKGALGLAASGVRYVDQVPREKAMPPATVTLDLMAFTVSGRVFRRGATEVWVDGGMGVARSSEFRAIMGPTVALRGQQRLTPDLRLVAQARYDSLEDDVSFLEGWAGLRAGWVAVGYRAVKFNVGPPLHGPEAGVSLTF